MKISKQRLNQIIKEELTKVNVYSDEEHSEYSVGDLVEINVSDDGYDTSMVILDSADEFVATHGYTTSAKLLVKVVQVSRREYED
mgnify:FL=1